MSKLLIADLMNIDEGDIRCDKCTWYGPYIKETHMCKFWNVQAQGNEYCSFFKRKESDIVNLIDAIGDPAMLEQTAEEASELAFACLKMARFLRGENTVHGRNKEELYDNLVEELADVYICQKELTKGVVQQKDIDEKLIAKMKRMDKRLEYYAKGAK